MNIKKFKVPVLVFILLSFIAESSIASQWVLITANDDVRVFVDMQSLQRNAQDVKVWEKWIFERHTSPNKKYNSVLILFKYHCDERTAHLLEFIGSSTLVDNYFKYPETREHKIEIEPDSVIETVFESVCRLKKTPQKR
jgi:surface-adhesin protein E